MFLHYYIKVSQNCLLIKKRYTCNSKYLKKTTPIIFSGNSLKYPSTCNYASMPQSIRCCNRRNAIKFIFLFLINKFITFPFCNYLPPLRVYKSCAHISITLFHKSTARSRFLHNVLIFLRKTLVFQMINRQKKAFW